MVIYIPRRGDIVWLEFEPQKGKEIQKTRPALVISPESYNHKVGLMLCAPITSKIKNYPFEVKCQFDKIEGVILADQVRSFDYNARNVKFIAQCKEETIVEVIEKLTLLIEL
jgi:mRNA interferase MazF